MRGNGADQSLCAGPSTGRRYGEQPGPKRRLARLTRFAISSGRPLTLDQQWQQLLGNDPDTVIASLAEAFEDNEAPAAPVGVDDAEVSLAVLAPAESTVPERMPRTTQAGNLTLRKLPKGEPLYALLISGHVLVTLGEAFAVAPGIPAARVIELRSSGPDAYGNARLECIMAGAGPGQLSMACAGRKPMPLPSCKTPQAN